jgi:hypothetical protein
MADMHFVLGFLAGAAIAGLTIVARSQDNRAMRDALMKIRWACAAELVASPLTIKIQNLASIGLGDYFPLSEHGSLDQTEIYKKTGTAKI